MEVTGATRGDRCGLFVVLALLVAAGACAYQERAREPISTREAKGTTSDRFPNVVLHTQEGEPVRFYDDLVKDHTILVNFMYARCEGACPGTTRNLVKVHRALGDHVGNDVLMLSISIDGEAVDTPADLRAYADRYGGTRPGWLYLTGDYDEVDAVRRSLGVYDLDPEIDADKTQHSGLITFGNDRTDRWAALPGLMASDEIARTVLRITR